MHRYKIIVQILLVLSILNPAFAAPIPREIPGSTLSSSVGPPPSDPLRTEGSAPSQVSAQSSEPAPPPHLSATDGPGQVPAPTTESLTSTPAHSATDATRPVPVQDSTAGGSTSGHYTAVSHEAVSHDTKSHARLIKNAKTAGAVAVILAAAGGMLKLTQWLQQRSEDDSS
jgi:hypothetical protein